MPLTIKIKITYYEFCQQFTFNQKSDVEKHNSDSSRILLGQQKKFAMRISELHGGMNIKTVFIERIQDLDPRMGAFAEDLQGVVQPAGRTCFPR